MAHLVMVCIVSLAVASTIGFALLPNMALRMDTASSKDLLDAPQLARIMTQKIRPLGDPIDDPKPNSVKH